MLGPRIRSKVTELGRRLNSGHGPFIRPDADWFRFLDIFACFVLQVPGAAPILLTVEREGANVKQIYRNMEEVLRRIDASSGVEEMLRETLRGIVGGWADEYGIASGRLYREAEDAYELIESVGEYGDAITGKTIPKNYPLLEQLESERVVTITPETPGFDPDFEAQFSDFDNPSHYNIQVFKAQETP